MPLRSGRPGALDPTGGRSSQGQNRWQRRLLRGGVLRRGAESRTLAPPWRATRPAYGKKDHPGLLLASDRPFASVPLGDLAPHI